VLSRAQTVEIVMAADLKPGLSSIKWKMISSCLEYQLLRKSVFKCLNSIVLSYWNVKSVNIPM
jgi:hypothetical protein